MLMLIASFLSFARAYAFFFIVLFFSLSFSFPFLLEYSPSLSMESNFYISCFIHSQKAAFNDANWIFHE